MLNINRMQKRRPVTRKLGLGNLSNADGSTPLKGDIDEVRISDIARDATAMIGGTSILTPAVDLSTHPASVASNAAPGTFVGALSMANTNGTFTYSLAASGDYTYFDIANGTTNLRTAKFIDSDAYIISIVGTESGGGGLVVTNDFTIDVTAVADTYMAFEVSAEVGSGVAAGGEAVGYLRAQAADSSATTFSLIDGRTDLFQITGDTNLVQVAGTDPGSLGTINWIQACAANAVTTNYLLIGVEVVRGTPAGTVFMFR